MLVVLISLIIMFICISMGRKFTGCDKRALYVSSEDLRRFKNKLELIETHRDILSL